MRDSTCLERALAGVTVVEHAAALKPACEYNPFEAIQSNIMGGRNVIEAAINQSVRRILALSTIFVQASAYVGNKGTRFSCAR